MVKDRKADNSRSRGTDVYMFGVKDRDASCRSNFDFSNKVRYSPKIKDRNFRPLFVEYSTGVPGKSQASTSFGDDWNV
jgi:hypothetical protein